MSISIDSDDMKFFEREASTNFSIFLNQNILFLECSKKDQTYISDILTLFEYIVRIKIKNKCENKDDLNLFFEQALFYAEWNNHSYGAYKDNFF